MKFSCLLCISIWSMAVRTALSQTHSINSRHFTPHITAHLHVGFKDRCTSRQVGSMPDTHITETSSSVKPVFDWRQFVCWNSLNPRFLCRYRYREAKHHGRAGHLYYYLTVVNCVKDWQISIPVLFSYYFSVGFEENFWSFIFKRNSTKGKQNCLFSI